MIVRAIAVALAALSLMANAAGATTIEADLRALAALPGQPRLVAAAGLTKADEPILTIEGRDVFAAPSSMAPRRLVIVGGLDADTRSPSKVISLVRWMKTAAPVQTGKAGTVSAVPSAAVEPGDRAALDRWITFQAPDVLVEVREDGRTLNLAAITSSTLKADDPSSALAAILAAAPPGRSPLRSEIERRIVRQPIEIATLLAKRYPATPSISYIPSVSWTNTLRLAALLPDPSLAEKVRQQTAPWVTEGRPLFDERILLTSIAGTMVFADLGGDAMRLARDGAKLASARKANGIAEYGQGWTDDMFMSSVILSRTGDYDASASLLSDYAARLQRADGVFIHATDGPFAWGRGNGFAAMGLTELLTVLPPTHPARARLLEIYRKHMAAVQRLQSPDGMWREVLDEPGAYREETATAMIMTAMARGVRLGWLPASYRPTIDRAWRALAAHVKDDGTLFDVCTGTGVGPTKRYYLDRAAITGADDRGGAMGLLASMEMVALNAAPAAAVKTETKVGTKKLRTKF